MKKLILIMRDYSYLRWLKLSNKPDYAWRQQKQMVIALVGCSWYLAVLTTFAIVSYKMGWSHYFPHPKNFIPVLLYGLLLFGPYVGFMWWWLDTLDDIPVGDTMSYQKLGLITWTTVVIGFYWQC